MKKDDVELYRDIQKNARMGMKAINTLAGKVYDDNLSMQLSAQGIKYSELYNKAADRLLDARAESYKDNAIEDMMLVGSIHTNTILDVSASHLADMVIQGSNKGITSMWKSMNQHTNASKYSVELAKELVDFEEKSIEALKKYL